MNLESIENLSLWAALVGYVIVAFGLGAAFTLLLLPYPLVYLLLVGLALFHVYYLAQRGGPIFLALMCLIAVLVLPVMAVVHDVLALAVAAYFIQTAALAVVLVLFAHALLPDPPSDNGEPVPAKVPSGDPGRAAREALKSTAAVLPLATLMIVTSAPDSILLLVYAGLFTVNPNLGAGRTVATEMVASTLFGGLAAMLFMGLLAAAPEFPLLVAMMLLWTLVLGSLIDSDRPIARYMPSATNAFLVLTSVGTSADASFTEAFLVRLGLVLLTTLYVVGALAALDRVWPGRPA